MKFSVWSEKGFRGFISSCKPHYSVKGTEKRIFYSVSNSRGGPAQGITMISFVLRSLVLPPKIYKYGRYCLQKQTIPLLPSYFSFSADKL